MEGRECRMSGGGGRRSSGCSKQKRPARPTLTAKAPVRRVTEEARVRHLRAQLGWGGGWMNGGGDDDG